MKTLNTYLTEKLKISSKSAPNMVKITDFDDLDLNIDNDQISSYYADAKYPNITRIRKNGTELLWWKWWKILAYNGPTSKENLNRAIGNNNANSYSTTYAELNKMNIITYNRKLRCLEAQPVSKWNV